MLTSEGGFITPELLNALAGYDMKTVVIIGAVLWYFKAEKEDKKEKE